MNDPGQTDTSVLEAIRRGDAETWSQFVNEYQGRLLSFAMARVPQRADAEDIVQNTFTSFLKVVDGLQVKVSLETYLFGIARNEVFQRIRNQHARRVCLIQDVYCGNQDDTSADAFAHVCSPDPSSSWCVSYDEEHQFLRVALTEVVQNFVRKLQKSKKLHNLKMVELLFYCQLSNIDIASQLNVSPGTVRVFKYRCLKHIREGLAKRCPQTDIFESHSENILTEIWEEQRLSCLKRSTLAAFLREDLSPEWFDYVDFHLTTMGCHFCRASFKDLQYRQETNRQQEDLGQRIMASTIGFLSRP